VSGCIAAQILDLGYYMEMSGQLHSPAPLPPGKKPLVPIGYEDGWHFDSDIFEILPHKSLQMSV